MGNNGRNTEGVRSSFGIANGDYGKKVSQVMESAGYTKVLEKSIDHIYVRNDFRSPFFKHDGKPRFIKDQ